MQTISFNEITFTLGERESILEGLERQGQDIPSSCRSGICQSCLLQATSGTPPAASQVGLKETLARQGYFLACKCYPESDLTVSLPHGAGISTPARVQARLPLGKDVVALRLVPEAGFTCQPGQYVNLVHDGTVRSYSVANLPDIDGYLELHVRRMPGGRMSNWLHDDLATGDMVEIRGPAGSCYYLPGEDNTFPVVLAGTGTGLAPLEGIARDALRQGHRGPVILIHGAADESGLYHESELAGLAAGHPQMQYLQALLNDGDPARDGLPAVLDTVLDDLDLGAAHVYLCGSPSMVNTMKTRVFLKGVGSGHIFSDPFVTAPPPGT